MTPPRPLDKKDIAAAVAASRSRLGDFQVRYTFRYAYLEAPTGAVEGVFQEPRPVFDQCKVFLAWRGDAMLRMVDWTGPSALGGGGYTYWSSFDGTRTMYYNANTPFARVVLGRHENVTETTSMGDGYCGVLHYHPDANAVLPPDEQRIPVDLLDIVSSDCSIVRPQTELVEGHPCYVVDVMTPWNTRSETLWLDPRRGFLPVRSQKFDRSKEENCHMESTITEAVECTGGIWLPVRCTRLVLADGTRHKIAVGAEDGGGLDIRINTGIEADFFDLLPRLPPGVPVSDREKGLSWITGIDKDRGGRAR
ncbi:MAG: hypothetical protein RBU25_02030 [Lentisphaeria bacterium]|jgi:hypothetical protein|nr:hypothetical protein [Lentisphaeria bacterium]